MIRNLLFHCFRAEEQQVFSLRRMRSAFLISGSLGEMCKISRKMSNIKKKISERCIKPLPGSKKY